MEYFNDELIDKTVMMLITALTDEASASELEREFLNNQQIDKTFKTLIEKLTDIQQRGEQELRVLKDFSEQDGGDTADIVKSFGVYFGIFGEYEDY